MLSPPAPISSRSIIGTPTGSPLPLFIRRSRATSGVMLMRGRWDWITHDLAVVPPMSKDTTLPASTCWPIRPATRAPAAGPDSISWIGNAVAVSTVIVPPLDVIRCRGQRQPSERRPSCRRCRYRRTMGWT